MTEREQVVLWLGSFMKNKEPMTPIPRPLIQLMYDELTKDTAITPIVVQKEMFRSEVTDWYCCGNCRQELDIYPGRWNYCPNCGKAVKWDD